MTNLSQELNDLISKHLPAQTVGVIQDRLKEADEFQSQIEHLKTSLVSKDSIIESKNEEIVRLTKTVEEYKKFDIRNSQLDDRESKLNKREILLEVEELKYRLTSEVEKTNFAKEVALGLVRNTEYRKTIHQNSFDNISEPPSPENNWIQTNKTHSSNNDSTEIIETA